MSKESGSPQPKKQKLCRNGYIYDGRNRVTKWPEEEVPKGTMNFTWAKFYLITHTIIGAQKDISLFFKSCLCRIC